MTDLQKRWFYLIVLSLIWGSSFILIKKTLVGLTPIQAGAIRIIVTSLTLFVVGFNSLKQIKKEHYKPIIITALLGTFFPVFLFSYAINGIDSSITSILNSLTPLNTLIIGALLFGFRFNKFQKTGVVIGFIGTLALIISSANVNSDQNYFYAVLPIIASILYALNVNILKKQLSGISALSIATGNFVVMFIPALILLSLTDFFTIYKTSDDNINTSLFYLVILSVLGTALGKTMFNKLVQIATPIFSASVTYVIPVVAVLWGVLDGEKIMPIQILASFIIFGGVFLSSKK